MRVSIWPGLGQPYASILEAARHAADTGWDGLYIADHFMPNAADDTRPTLECGALLAGLSAVVPRVRIGSLVYGNTYRHPAVLANMAATTDHISGGRFTLGVGAGWQVNEHQQYGLELPSVKRRLDRFVEALRILRGLLRAPRTTVDGEYYQVADAVCEPKPVQDRMPLLIGGSGEKRMLGIVAEYADAWNAWGHPELIAHKSGVLDDFCARVGRDPKTIARTAQAMVVVDGPLPDAGTRPVIGGSPEKLAATIAAYRAIGLDELIVPDGFLGTGAERLKAMDVILGLVRA
ncbi:TIGR03560 family F420-dependent LLM class oxidoreductase [Actinoplanes sp. TBRC 11911]|uniref:TIGR03560 family F420-dependent LLM class oxidoreductase n=1 Tax=Actinoplanes sp. TBRC 11911 TaxID=2729386 RepID=UPI00145C5960|nr:TIGR03560 family F420-dependent LLM class oxidoreductase [Actinoplanes sp. TBRC 11911]NMO56134.1 TIGR03560 family F420-dependent LLM class oxidoreductase [Actinoplanes sp. TBRC 11911]